MDKIEFTDTESKELNEEVRNCLELIRDTEALIGDGMEKLKGANWAKLWSCLDKLVFYPKTTKEIWLFSKLDATFNT